MDIILTIFVFVFGACIGSFLNVVIWRVPRGQSIVFPPSHCPKCGRGLHGSDNIPILSWILLRGRCRFCRCGISVRYPLIETFTAVLFGGLFVCYYIFRVRTNPDAGAIEDTWCMLFAHAVLLCGLLVCSVVDVECWLVPVEVCWFVSLVGVLCATAQPFPFMPTVSSATGAAMIGASAGLIISVLLQRARILLPSFIDAGGKPIPYRRKSDSASARANNDLQRHPVSAASSDCMSARKEIMREVLFLLPAGVLAITAYLLVTRCGVVGELWTRLTERSGIFSVHFAGFLASLTGFIIGGLWIWATRILGTLAFNREAMGMGDVYILASVGAVTGWIIPSVTYFIAPLIGIAWAAFVWVRKGRKEVPYGPWLAAATLISMLAYDRIINLWNIYADTFGKFGK